MRRAAVAALVVVAAGCGSEASVPDRFSGMWRIADGRTIPIRSVAADEGKAALRELGGKPCEGSARYYRATYFGGVAHLAGCATGDGKRMSGRFDDNGRRGRIEQRLVSEHPPTWKARVIGDGGTPFTVTARRVR